LVPTPLSICDNPACFRPHTEQGQRRVRGLYLLPVKGCLLPGRWDWGPSENDCATRGSGLEVETDTPVLSDRKHQLVTGPQSRPDAVKAEPAPHHSKAAGGTTATERAFGQPPSWFVAHRPRALVRPPCVPWARRSVPDSAGSGPARSARRHRRVRTWARMSVGGAIGLTPSSNASLSQGRVMVDARTWWGPSPAAGAGQPGRLPARPRHESEQPVGRSGRCGSAGGGTSSACRSAATRPMISSAPGTDLGPEVRSCSLTRALTGPDDYGRHALGCGPHAVTAVSRHPGDVFASTT
jgi:hypothetical protein